MRDLYVMTADADAQAVMDGVLSRDQALGIRPISFKVVRHPRHDAGVVKDGPGLMGLGNIKKEYNHVVLLWDHHGSGREQRDNSEAVEKELTESLDRLTWKGRCLAIAIQPELEEWLWHSPHALLKVLDKDQEKLDSWCQEFADTKDIAVEEARQQFPKEMFDKVFHRCTQRRHPRPDEFKRIAEVASLPQWQNSPSFQRIAHTLPCWFPPA